MNVIQFFQTKSRLFYFFLILLGLTSSVANIGTLMLINNALAGKTLIKGQQNYMVYICLMAISFATNRIFQNYIVKLTSTIVVEQELAIIQKVRNSSYESFERLGPDKIYAALGDARMLGRIPQMFISFFNAFIIVTCSLVYLFIAAPLGGVTVISLMIFLLTIYLIRDKEISRQNNIVRDLQDEYYHSLQELIQGFKQIRISNLRNNNLFNRYINLNREKSKQLSIKTNRKYVANEMIGIYSWYLVLGTVIFILPAIGKVSLAQVTIFVATVLFMVGPISQLVMFFPMYSIFKISINRINKIDTELKVDSLDMPAIPIPARPFRSIRFEDIVYSYNANDKTSFQLNIKEITFKNDEIIFIAGGNGSGKTTFINILTGLCKPESGRIYVDDKEVGWTDFCSLSNSMAVVYTTHHLFKNNYDDHDLSEGNGHLRYLTDLFNLNGVLKLLEDRNWVNTSLSKGQQKRLALLLSIMEDKPLIILDEWAAEQDPYNRRQFYTKWLPLIKGMGKTVIAISHDDDYYHVADRILRFDYGKIAHDTSKVSQIV
ncbi:ATP-binding cassette domain-containing protein [Puia sp.]|jgi:ABC-type siderophore export system fused ATPase/permease subunit|uniref:ATP-binding cassette domain-containing protein n=1 Tax=Puia sp. TaxID=2045100 RepID=UPI002F413608